MPSKRTPTEPTYGLSELPEMLRSPLIAGIVQAALDLQAADTDGAAGEYGSATRAVLTQAVAELEEWHRPRPRPVDMNGGQ